MHRIKNIKFRNHLKRDLWQANLIYKVSILMVYADMLLIYFLVYLKYFIENLKISFPFYYLAVLNKIFFKFINGPYIMGMNTHVDQL